MKVTIRYENVPFSCFICRRIGHSDKDCPNSEVGEGCWIDPNGRPTDRVQRIQYPLPHLVLSPIAKA
jgi:hypothetical protein